MLEISPIPVFNDNYIWWLERRGVPEVAVVDPGDPDPVLQVLRGRGLRLATLLITHHHWDHTGGIAALRRRFPDCRVIGPQDPRIDGITEAVKEGQVLLLEGLGMRLQVIELPGHTATHIGFYGEGVLFCGDTLFTAGCGRVFDGTFEQLATSLERLASLPPETRVHCAHEYTLDNLGFARWVEANNPAILEREEEVQRRRKGGLPTVPSTLALELATNPFLRTHVPAVIQAAEAYAGVPLTTRAAVFRAVRQWKDREYD